MARDDDDETEAYSRWTDPSTSHEAAERVRPTKLEQEVFGTLLEHWPRFMTSIEVAGTMRKPIWSISPRFAPLRRKKLVEQTKKPALNSSGRIVNMLAWRAIRPPSVQLALFADDLPPAPPLTNAAVASP